MNDNDEIRQDAWTILVQISADKDMADSREFAAWMKGVGETVGAAPAFNREEKPWAVGDHGRYRTDHFGLRYLDRKPYANVWQEIEGVPSITFAYCWAAIHLVQPLVEAGYRIEQVSVSLTDESVAIG